MRKSYPSYSLLTLSGLILAGSCSIIAEVDRTKIPQEGTPSDGGQATGGTSGTAGGGRGGTPTGGTAGDGGMGGEPTGGTTSGGTAGDAGGGMGGAGMGGAGDGGMGGEPGVCGNGEVESGEDCDDGDMPPANNDGCNTNCAEEAGWECTGEPSTCVAAACGDRIEAGAEVCDDGNSLNCGTCNQTCAGQTPSMAASGTISPGASAPGDIVDGDYFILNDGTNPAVEFEFDVLPADDGATRAGAVQVDFDPTANAAALQSAIITAINGVTTTLRIQASAGTAPNVNLVNELPGFNGNQTTGEFVANTTFMISAMAGGAAHNCPTGTGCVIGADCANGTCLPTNLCN